MKNVVAYCRTAAAMQSDPISGVKRQAEELRCYAKRHGLVVAQTVAETTCGLPRWNG